MSIEDDKTNLRHRMRTLRAEAAARDPDAAEKLAAIFPMKLLERYGPVISAYVPINEELDPMPLLDRLARAGAETCLPRMTPTGISWRLWSPGEPLERRGFGLSEPPEDAPEATPTLVLTPLLAFDTLGNRLGYGRGHYDQALSVLRAKEVTRYLTEDCGIAAARLETLGLGERFPLDPKKPDAEENRRVEFQALS